MSDVQRMREERKKRSENAHNCHLECYGASSSSSQSGAAVDGLPASDKTPVE
jgi:hypothetical protein